MGFCHITLNIQKIFLSKLDFEIPLIEKGKLGTFDEHIFPFSPCVIDSNMPIQLDGAEEVDMSEL